jgi:hypothetical protein
MSGFYQNLQTDTAGAFSGSVFLRDYTHASKTFRPNAYENAPKFKFLFHVYFQLNPTGLPSDFNLASYGLLVKTVKLPGFNLDVATLNQYNRKRLIQTKIKYDPVNITFHDDNGNSIRKMWKGYYNYYYADGTKPQVVFNGARGATLTPQLTGGGGFAGETDATYNSRTQYQPSITGNASWGYQGSTSDPTGQKIPFFKNITVFGFNQHNFVAYTLINPVITAFSHDTYDYAQGNGTMEHQMTLDYETVVYNEGAIDGKSPDNIVTGFGEEAFYDRRLSPIARPGANAKILGQGGLVDGAGGTLKTNRNIVQETNTADGTAYNTFKNTNIVNIAKSEVVNGINNSVGQTPNRNVNVATPIFGAIQSRIGTAGAKLSGALSAPPQIGGNPSAGSQTSGQSGPQ